MSIVLYRKYRPQAFSEIIGQEPIVKTLTNAITRGLISHAYLFSGPKGSGKTSLARLFAKAVNCRGRKKGEAEPCNKCNSCLEITEGRSIDLLEIDAASHRGIDDIRELRDGIRFVPTKSKYKVYVIDECLTKDHLISMADGSVKTIAELTNGDKIFSIDINTGMIAEGTVSNWFKRKTSKIVKIKTPQTVLETTPKHRLWALKNDLFVLTEAENLREGDFLLSPVLIPHTPKNKLTPEQLSLLALIQCDGHVSKDSATIQIEISKDKDYFENVFKRGLKAWDIKEIPVITKTARGTKLIRVYSEKLKEILSELNCPPGKKSNIIDIPPAVFQAPLDSIRVYVDTCFCCEGNIDFNHHLNLYRLHFNCVSRIFTKKLQLLLKKFGVGSSFLEIKSKKTEKHSIQYRLTLSHYDLKTFQQHIGLSLKRKAKLLEKGSLEKERQDIIPIENILLKIRREKEIKYSEINSQGIYLSKDQHLTRAAVTNFIEIANSFELKKYLQFRYERVRKIEIKNEVTDVYDFTVENTHTFIANGICSSNCHQLTKEAANALLKTLEEPPEYAIFILATTEIHKMIPTILSRCQRFEFRRLTLEELLKKLEIVVKKEKIKIEKSALEFIALNSQGSLRDAESLLDQIFTLYGSEREIKAENIKDLLGLVEMGLISQFTDFLAQKKPAEAINFLNGLEQKGMDLSEFNKALVNYLRQALILKIMGGDGPPTNNYWWGAGLTREEFQKLKEQSEVFKEEEIKRIINLFLEAQNKMKYSPIIQLPLELAIIEACEQT